MSGYVHVYTGDGKGKTTAALGTGPAGGRRRLERLLRPVRQGHGHQRTGRPGPIQRPHQHPPVRPAFIRHGPDDETSAWPSGDWRNAARPWPRANTGW